MYKQKIGISLGNNYPIPTDEVAKTVKKIGFDAISPELNPDIDVSKTVAAAKEYGLEIQSFHSPFGRAADMWSNDKALSKPAKRDLTYSIDKCAEFNVPVLVVHTWIGFENSFENCDKCFENFDEIAAYAESKNVKIAFENTEGEESLFALIEHFKNNDSIGFCWDSGHEMCYNRSEDLLSLFGDRLLITHLNDNLGISRFDGKTYWTDDLHLLPYDGIADWDYNITRLKNSRKLEILNFELNINSKPNRHDNDIYSKMSIEEYFTEAYKRACKIAYRYSK